MCAIQIPIQHPFWNGGVATGARKPKTTFVFLCIAPSSTYAVLATSDLRVRVCVRLCVSQLLIGRIGY